MAKVVGYCHIDSRRGRVHTQVRAGRLGKLLCWMAQKVHSCIIHRDLHNVTHCNVTPSLIS